MSIADELGKLEELRRSGALSEAEFAQAKPVLLSGPRADDGQQLGQDLAEQIAEVRRQNELARIDREWEAERQQYLIPYRYRTGKWQVPTTGMGIRLAVVGGVFGLLWTA